MTAMSVKDGSVQSAFRPADWIATPAGSAMHAGWIEEEWPRLVDLLQGFVRAKSLNPPGCTREAAQIVAGNAGTPRFGLRRQPA